MMKLKCKDINPTTTCDYEATGDSAREVAEKMVEHAKIHHTADVENMTDEEMLKSFEAKVHE
jgi:predicted small metal-binding protein